MQIILTKTLNPKRGLVEGAVFDWTRPVISEMDRQCKELGITDWYKFSAELTSRIGRIQTREDGRAKYMDGPPETPQPPPEIAAVDEAAKAASGGEPATMAEALLRGAEDSDAAGIAVQALDQAQVGTGTSTEVRRVQRGPQKGR